jgi:2-oxoglutarate ferredoxin oxidoreductase subunit alpha
MGHQRRDEPRTSAPLLHLSESARRRENQSAFAHPLEGSANNEVRYKEYFLDDAEIVVVGFGTAGRVALSAVREARAQGIKVGLLRPITVSPFPVEALNQLTGQARAFLVTEMNMGQMLDDVQMVVRGRVPVEFYGRPGGVVPFPDEILSEIQRINFAPVAEYADPRDAWLTRMNARA